MKNPEVLEVCKLCEPLLQRFSKGVAKPFKTSSQYCDGVFCVFRYEGLVRDALLRYKFKQKEGYYRTFSQYLCQVIHHYHQTNPFDAVIAVPLHPKRKRERGYNQAELLSKEIAQCFNIPEYSHCIERVVHTPRQSLANAKEKRIHMENVFKVNVNKLNINNLLLVDDIYTTGSTVDACAKVLKKAGVKEVYVSVIASSSSWEGG